MAEKIVGTVLVLNVEPVDYGEFKGWKCQGMTDTKDLLEFYRSNDESPKENDVYNLVLTSSKFKPVIRIHPEK